jgi:hypothetical protein
MSCYDYGKKELPPHEGGPDRPGSTEDRPPHRPADFPIALRLWRNSRPRLVISNSRPVCVIHITPSRLSDPIDESPVTLFAAP